MKKIFAPVAFLIAVLQGIAQPKDNGVFKTATISSSLTLNGYKLTSISNDTTLTNQSTLKATTEYSIKKLIESRLSTVLYSTGTYSNPSWLTAVAWSKLTGTPTTLSGYGITTPIAVASGGTGNTSFNTGYIPYGNGSSALSTTSVFNFDVTNNRVYVRNCYLQGNSTFGALKLMSDWGTDEFKIVSYGPNGTNGGMDIINGYPSGSGYFTRILQNQVEALRIAADNSLIMGTTTSVASSILTLASTSKGMLVPRMTTTQKNAIASPSEGLAVYDLTLHKLYVYDGSAWQAAW